MSFILMPEWMEYLNYPGLELWKFADLAIFVTAGVFVLRKPIKNALAARRESIRREIKNAEEERDRAAEKLAEADALLVKLDADVQNVRQQAQQEAQLERERQKAAAEHEIQRLKTLTARELEILQKTARQELQLFLAKRSVEIAKESVTSQLRPDDDLRLIKDRIGELRRARG